MEMEFEKLKWWEYFIIIPIVIVMLLGIFAFVMWLAEFDNQAKEFCESEGGEKYTQYNGISGDEDFCLIDDVEYKLRRINDEWRIVK